MTKKNLMKKILLILCSICLFNIVNGQDNRLILKDTVQTKYPYIFPIFGNFLHDIGIDLAYPVGVMGNLFYADQEVIIPDISIGFSNGTTTPILTDITRLVDFEDVRAKALNVNVRPDLWILPFMNIYGIFGKSWVTTEVPITYPIEFTAIADLTGTSFGIGSTFAGGVNGYFFVVDMNRVWSNMSNFEEPVGTSVLSFRAGHTFKVRTHPESNFAVWAGAMRVTMGGITEGTISLGDVLPQEVWDRRDELVTEYYEWYDNVDPIKQGVADRTLTPLIEEFSESNGNLTVAYSLTKEPRNPWNMIIGGQYQYNKHWQARTEFGLIGDRKSYLFSINYRFGVQRK